jgi:hypothetical protein
MANTYKLIEAQTLGSNQASITLGAGGTIPQTYTDLQVLYSTKHTATSGYSYNLFLAFNGATSRYYELLLYNAGGGSLGSTNKPNVDPYLNWSALAQGSGNSNMFSTGQFYITNYTSSNPKSISSEFVSEDNTTTPWSIMNAGLWDPTSNVPITSMTLSASSIKAGSTFYLYGIKNS